MWDILIEYLTKKNKIGTNVCSQNYFCGFLFYIGSVRCKPVVWILPLSVLCQGQFRGIVSSPKAMAMASWKERNISWPGTSWHVWQNNRLLQKCVSLFNFIADAWKWSGMCLSSSNKWTSDILTPPSRCKWVQMTFGFYWEVRERSDAANFLFIKSDRVHYTPVLVQKWYRRRC